MERWNISIVKFVLIRSDMAAMLKSNIVCENKKWPILWRNYEI